MESSIIDDSDNQQETSSLKSKDFALHQAILNDDIETVKAILSDARVTNNLNDFDKDGNTAFYLAVKAKKNDIIELLIADPRVDVNLQNTNQFVVYPPFHTLCRFGSFENVQSIIFQRKDLNINATNKFGGTPLTESIGANRMDIFQLLLEQPQLTLDISNRKTTSIISLAAMQARHEMLRLLLSDPRLRIDPKSEDIWDSLNKMYACKVIASLEKRAELVKEMLEIFLSNEQVRQSLFIFRRAAILKWHTIRHPFFRPLFQEHLERMSLSVFLPLYDRLCNRLNGDVVGHIFTYLIYIHLSHSTPAAATVEIPATAISTAVAAAFGPIPSHTGVIRDKADLRHFLSLELLDISFTALPEYETKGVYW